MAAATLYYTPTSCGVASFIAAFKGGLIQSGKVAAYEADIRGKKILTGPDAGKSFFDVNPAGNVPALVLADGTLLNQGAAVLQWIADNSPAEAGLAPAYGTSGRYLVQNALNQISSEIHANFGPLFYGLEGEAREAQIKKLLSKLDYVITHQLAGGKKFLVGDSFTIADSYFAVVLSWAPYVSVDLPAALVEYRDNIFGLDFVKEARAAVAAASPK